MTLPSFGVPLSINDIHVEVTGTSGTTASLNDSDIRSLIGKANQAQNAISEYYNASFIQTLNTSYTPNAGYEGLTSTSVSASDITNMSTASYASNIAVGSDNNVNTGKIFKNTTLESTLSGKTILTVTTLSVRFLTRLGATRSTPTDAAGGVTKHRFYTGSPGSWTLVPSSPTYSISTNAPPICGACGEQNFDYDLTKTNVMASFGTTENASYTSNSPGSAWFGNTTDRDNWLKAGAPIGFTELQPISGPDNNPAYYLLTVNLTYQ
jgi:hypothetical protein